MEVNNNNAIEAKVAYIFDSTNEKLVINMGSDEGVQEGNKFLVYRLGDEVIDPDTKETLETLEIIIGKGKAIHVQRKITTIETTTVKRTTVRTEGSGILNMVMPGRFANYPVTETREETLPFELPLVGDLVRRI